ncbi:melanoma-associated antigen B5-like [Saccopteryx bilineata]|uniref:melanoma-associated antigen B5-like n=1 Tax=Saccopteryx bilineata TaxID=59482 RepID=UPI00338E70EC
MPRRRKSKHHNHQKVQQALDEARSSKKFEAADTVEEDPPSSSSSLMKEIPQSSSATDTTNISQVSSTVSTTTIISSGAFHTRSEDSDDEEFSCPTEILFRHHVLSDFLAAEVKMLERFIFSRYDMKKPILKEHMLMMISEIHHDQFAEILEKASRRIEILFALDLKEKDPNRHSYELFSKLKLPNNGRVNSGTGFPKTSLLMYILAMIFLNGNRATEEELWAFLSIMEVYPGKYHIIYEQPRKLIMKDLVNLKYLEYRRIPNTHPPHCEFLWGPQAVAETSKLKVLEYFAKVTEIDPRAFSPHYEEALREEEERAQAGGASGAGARNIGQEGSNGQSTRVSTPSDV